MLLDTFMESMVASMESTTNTTNTTTTNTNTTNTNTNTTNAKGGNSMENTNSKRTNSKAHNTNTTTTTNTTTLPEVMPERCNACIGKEGAKQDAQTSLIFQYHIRKALAAYGGTASICQIYNFLRGDSPLRLEKDGSPKVDGLPRWAGLGNSKLFRNYTEGTLLTYTHKVCSNGKVRSVAVAGPMLQEFPAAK